MLVEQAIFTSARTERLDGYQLVAATDGISADDSQSLTQWCPAHDSLVESSPQATSINFHPLPSGNYCISRTMLGGAEYSGRGGGRVFTQCFVVPPKLLQKFSNNPFRMLEAISAAGHVRYYEAIPTRLETFQLVGRSSVIDRSLLRKLRTDPRRSRLCAVVAAVVGNRSVCVIERRAPELWLAALFSVLPVECRTQVSFCTGLQFSGRRPFRCASRRTLERDVRKSSQRSGITLLDVDELGDSGDEIPRGWATLAGQILAGKKLTTWEGLLGCNLPGLKIENLNALAQEMLQQQRFNSPPVCSEATDSVG